MKQFYVKVKQCALILMVVLCMAVVTQQAAVPVYAYTQEEKDAAKAWLSANGYSPDMSGAQAAYADYMNGKFGAIPGLPEPNVKPQETPAEEPADTSQADEEKDNKKDKKPKKDSQKDSEEEDVSDGNAVTPPATGETPEAGTATDAQMEKPEQTDAQDTDKAADDLEDLVESVELPELTLPTPTQQEFADMIDVFLESFSEDDQTEISKAKERLERQKQERAAAEKEAETAKRTEHAPQKNVILILCGVLALAIICLGIVIVKKNSKK